MAELSGLAPTSAGSKIVAHARQQLTWGTVYDPSYVRISYPNGDVPRSQGVCTDVVVRAFRAAGIDLQKLVYEHRRTSNQPTDRNIDHRRCPNLVDFFRAYGLTLTTKVGRETLTSWKPGDVVFWKLDNGRDHVGIVTDRRDAFEVPHVIHNLSTPLEEPLLTRWKIVGHYRYPKK